MMEKSKVAVDESASVDYRNETNSIVSLPPAYAKPTSTTLKVARILSVTLLAVTTIIGVMVLLGIYIHQGYQCQCDKEMMSASQMQPMSAARIDRMDHDNTYTTDEKDAQPKGKGVPMPLKLELDAALGTILKDPKNKKAEVNCVAETRKASQVIHQDPKMLMTPFGNFSTDPKLVQLMGERMVMSCISAVKQPNKKSSKAKKAAAKLAAGLLPRPRRSTKEMCSCNCDC
ncbi:uncharacterized protein TNIN_218251 [Trichonephila inaurata madagascariensis]|uniref:Uncharacterized protein n=2 Tax=Trichonephila TaxID=2585208 RepID=A0A8X6XUY6_9ARAC|nr:uncharacterized protein TNIN_218251 [Trichonephila inaurata madagascariensis]